MSRVLRRCFAVAVLASPLANAAPPPPLATLQRPDGSTLRVDADGTLVRVAAGGETRLAETKGGKVTLRNITVPGFGSLAEARIGSRAIFVGANGTLVADERVGPNEDHDLTRVVTADAQGLRRWQESPTSARCDARPPLFLTHLDPTTKAWVRDALPVPAAPELAAHAPLTLPPLRRALRFSAASTDGRSESADLLGAPRELDDASDATALAVGSPARGAFVTALAPRDVELTAIHVTSDSPPAALVLVGGVPARPRWRLPLKVGTTWFALPQPLRGPCVSFVVDASERAPVSIAEIGLHASDDAPGGLELLAAAVAHDAADSEGAAHSLEADPAGASVALRAMPTASASGRRRLLEVVAARRAPLDPPDVVQLASFVSIATADERAPAVRLLARQGDPAVEPLLTLLGDASQTVDARVDVVRVFGALLQAGRAGAALPSLFEALHDEALALEAERALASAAPRNEAVGHAAAAHLDGLGLGDPRVQGYVEKLVAIVGAARDPHALDELGFSTAWPFAVTARVLDARGKLHAPSLFGDVATVLRESKDPTLRLVAVSALPDARGPAARMLYVSAARDADALVRERALVRLHDGGVTGGDVLRPAADDTWPQIRSLAYAELGCGATQLFRDRVFAKHGADADPDARAAALGALARCPGTTGTQLAKAIDRKQPAPVREAAAGLLADADPSVLPVVARSLDGVFARGGSELPDTAVALLRAIGRLGAKKGGDAPFDDRTLVLLRDSASDPFYPTVRMAALDALSRGCPAGTARVLDRAARDPEPAVVRAVDLARQRCTR